MATAVTMAILAWGIAGLLGWYLFLTERRKRRYLVDDLVIGYRNGKLEDGDIALSKRHVPQVKSRLRHDLLYGDVYDE